MRRFVVVLTLWAMGLAWVGTSVVFPAASASASAGLPAAASEIISVSTISAGQDHSCAVTATGAVRCWGANDYGQLGNGTTTASLVPVGVVGLSSGAARVSVSISYSCAVTTTGAAKCWGWNEAGSLGNGTRTGSLVPVGVSGLSTGVAAISTGWNSMNVIVTPGDVTGDVNGDIIARDTSGRLWLYPGNGVSGVSARRQIGAGWQSYTITNAANMNTAGRPDLLARDSAGNLWLYPLSGNAVFAARTKIGSGWSSLAFWGPGDLSGDGRADVLARSSVGQLLLYRGNGTGGVAAGTVVGSGWSGMTALVTPGNWDHAAGNDMVARDAAGRLWLHPGNNASGWLVNRQISGGWTGMNYIG